MKASAVALAGLLSMATAACADRAPPSKLPALSTTNTNQNVSTLGRFIEQQCFDRASDPGAWDAALSSSGWQAKRTQTAVPRRELDLDVWEFPHLTLLRGQPVTAGVWTCSLNISGAVAPTMNAVKLELSKIAKTKPNASGEWVWRRAPLYELHMTADPQPLTGGIFVNVEVYRLPWWRALLG